MKRSLFPITLILFGIAIGGIVYHVYNNLIYSADVVKVRLDEINNHILENQDKLKANVKEIIVAQIRAATKDLLDKSVYNKDMELLNEKLNRLLEKR